MPDEKDPFRTFDEFWPCYLGQHRRRATRLLHALGTLLALLAIAKSVIDFNFVWLLMAPVIGYGVAWIAHAYIEKNHPATFTYPLWSLCGDLYMLWLWLTGRLESELAKHKILT